MPGTLCPHCHKELPEDFLRDAPRDRKLACPLCARSILISKIGKLIPLSDTFGETVTLSEWQQIEEEVI